MLYIFAYFYIKLIPPTGSLKEIYLEYRNNKLSKEELTLAIEQFCNEHALEISQLIDESIMLKGQLLHNEMKKNIVRKMCRMKVLEETKHLLPDEDLNDNIKTAQKSAVYMYYRGLYNDISLLSTNKELQCALFFFIRNYCYSGMFRYNDKGEFNVPYGGIAYNNKTLDKKISYYHSTALINHFAQCSIDNLDFEDFLNKHQPEENDFTRWRN